MENRADRIVLIEFYARQVAVLQVAQAEQRKKASTAPKGPGASPAIPTDADKRMSDLADRARADGITIPEIQDFVDVLDGERELLVTQIAGKLGLPAQRHAEGVGGS